MWASKRATRGDESIIESTETESNYANVNRCRRSDGRKGYWSDLGTAKRQKVQRDRKTTEGQQTLHIKVIS